MLASILFPHVGTKIRGSACLFALVQTLTGCGTSDTQTTVDAGGDVSSEIGEEVPEAPKPIIDPARFDCRSLPTLPTRTSTTPEACLRDPSCKTKLVVGHRGAGGDLGRIAPEDTLAAYRAGIVLGLDMVETDPRPTKDGFLVNMHDTDVSRTTNGTGKVDEMTFEMVRALKIKQGEIPGEYGCEKVPTLEEILALCKGRVMVLVDANKTSRVDLLVDAIRKSGTLDWAVFDTSDLSKIDEALKLEPKLLIMPRIEKAEEADMILARYKDHPPVLVEVDAKIFPKATAQVHAAGLRVMTDVFTTDIGVKLGSKPSEYLKVYAAGADAIQSDLPDLVLEAIGRRPASR